VSHNKIGDVRRARGDLGGALSAYEACHGILKRLAAGDPSNTEWQRDLSVSHERIGDVRVACGELGGALSAYEAGLAIRERLAAVDPTNTGWQRDLTASHQRIGDVRRAQGDLAGALRPTRRASASARTWSSATRPTLSGNETSQ
jgi:Flp pilus assembly protein TadD